MGNSLATKDGRLYIISGASRSGKTAWTAKKIKPSRRVFAYDPDDQFSALPGFIRLTTFAQLAAAADNPNNQRVAFVPSGDIRAAFDFFAKCAFHWGRFHGGGDVVAEELADVTTTAKAPGAWGVLVRRGLKRGLNLYCISQRWSEADKTAFGNASEFVIFRNSSTADIDYIARKTKIPREAMHDLKPLEFIQYDAATEQIERKKLTFR